MSLTMLSVSTASANTAPFLYAPSLNLVSETSTGAKFTANEVPGATQYEFAWSSQYRWQRSFFYANPPTHGFTITGFLYRALPDSVYHYWVRAIWKSGSHVEYGPWSGELTIRTYSASRSNTAPSLSAPTLSMAHETSRSFTYTASAVPGATQYETARSWHGGPRQYHYSYSPARTGQPFYGTYAGIQGAIYDFWVRAIWRSGTRTEYGAWSNKLVAQVYPTWSTISQNASPAVVQVSNFNLSALVEGSGVGSGFFVAGQFIVTNWHVVALPNGIHSQYWYRQNGGSWNLATLVAYSRYDDLALLKPDYPAHIFPLSGGLSHPPHVGQVVADIGFPLGVPQETMTSGGHIAAVGQTVKVSEVGKLYDMLTGKIDTYQGDSGSPVLNHWGQVIGVNDDVSTAYKHFTPLNASATDGIISLQTLAQFLHNCKNIVSGINEAAFTSY